jgi:demethylmenaquinone methyltransferase / 2-methoxy-6-polyprenyl-1,4-benzoquinol methylase
MTAGQPQQRPGTPSPAAQRSAQGVQAMFNRVAPRYDLANTMISFGQDRGWRLAAARATRLAPAEVALDVACGTGALTRALARLQPDASVLGADFAWEMVRRAPEPNLMGRLGGGEVAGAVHDAAGRLGDWAGNGDGGHQPVWRSGGRRVAGLVQDAAGRLGADQAGAEPRYLVADALALPFPDASLDVVTIAFGLRNLPQPDAGLREFRRVLRPGGRLVVCEFSRPSGPRFGQVYDRYLTRLLPVAARGISSDPEAYRYLVESIGAWPDQPGLARRLRRAGFVEVRWRNLTGGIVALHRGVVPTEPDHS